MKEIIVAYPTKDIALKLRSLLVSEGFEVSHVCALGSSVLSIAGDFSEGVVVCAAMLSDMSVSVLAHQLPMGFDVIAISKNGKEDYTGNLINLTVPLNKDDFLQTVSVLVSTRSSFNRRDKDESELLSTAKLILMNSKDITESQAHRYLQKESMRTGKKISVLAKEIVNEFTE